MLQYHRSVMVREVIENISVCSGKVYLDATFGEGGHSEALLDSGAEKVVALDRDKEAIATYQEKGRLRSDPRLKIVCLNFSQATSYFPPQSFDGILADLGVSTRQLLESERGFSFSQSGPLDMRMDREGGRPLSTLLENINAVELAERLERAVDMKRALPVARRLLEAFHARKIQNTSQLASLVGAGRSAHGKHPATPLFLALRMLVNDEMGEIEQAVPGFIDLLKPKGRLAIITFHSSEDRLVKILLKKLAGKCVCGLPQQECQCPREPRVRLLTKKPIEPSRDEVRSNPRSRSAKLRCAEKV